MAGTLALPTLVQKVVLDAKEAIAAAKTTEASLKGAGREASKLGSTVGSTGKQFRIGSLAFVAASAAIVVGLHHVVNAAADYATSVRKLQSVTGASAEDASRLAFTFERLGISSDAAARPIVQFSKLIATGGGNLKQFFTAAELTHLSLLPIPEQLLALNDKFHELNSATERNALLQVALGRGSLVLRRFFTATRAELVKISSEAKKFGLVLTEDNLEAFKKFSDGSRELGQAFKGLEVQVGLALIPAFETMDKVLTTIVTGFNALPGPVKTFATDALLGVVAIGLISKGGSLLLGVLKPVASALLGAAEAAVFAGADFAGFAATEEVVAAASAEAAAGIGLAAGALATIGAGAALVGIGLFVAKVIKAHEEAKKLAEQFTTVAAVQAEIKRRQDAIDAAQRSGRSHDKGVDESQAEAAGIFGPEAKDRQRAAREAGKGMQELKARERELADQEKRLGTAMHPTSEGLKERNKAVDEAVIGAQLITVEQENVTKAADAFDKAIRTSGVGSKEAAKAQRDLAAAVIEQQQVMGETDPAKIQEAAQQAILKQAQATTDALKKEAEAAKKARDEEIKANTELIASFDLLSDQVFDPGKDREDALNKVADAEQKLADVRDDIETNRRHLTRTPELNKELAKLQREEADATRDLSDARAEAAKTSESASGVFEKNLVKNAQFELDFIGNLKKIANAGGTALAAELAAQGPKAAGAAAEVVKKIGTDGFANLEKESEHAMIVAKIMADSKWDEWPGNFAEKGKAAGKAAFDAVIKELQDIAKEHPELKIEVEAEITKIQLAGGIAAGLPVGPGSTGLLFAEGSTGHLGGIVRRDGIKRFHKGGLTGDEVPAVLLRGESVLTQAATAAIGSQAILAANRGDFGPLSRAPAVTTFNQRGGDVNVGTVVAHNYDDFLRQLERDRRRAELQRI